MRWFGGKDNSVDVGQPSNAAKAIVRLLENPEDWTVTASHLKHIGGIRIWIGIKI